MSLLDQDLAFSFPHIRRLQELGIRAIEVAEETARQQEESMKRLQSYIADLPPGVDTRRIEATLDRNQGTMVAPIYEETKQYFRRRLSQLEDNILSIDRQAGEYFEEETQESKRIKWQIHSAMR